MLSWGAVVAFLDFTPLLLADDSNGSISTAAVEKAVEMASKAASQPVQWWGALFTIGSLVCVFLVVKNMLNFQRDTNLMLLNMVKAKDEYITKLNERLVNFIEQKNGSNLAPPK